MTEHKIKEGRSPLDQAFEIAQSSNEMVILVSAPKASRIIVDGDLPAKPTERQKHESQQYSEFTP